ncbi:MAG: hypothetical protein ABIK09_19045 [Pseudomonadota bacterium]
MSRRNLFTLLAMIVLVPRLSADDRGQRPVIPPGQESVIQEIIAAADAAAPSCSRGGVEIKEDHVRVLYHCDGGAEVPVLLLHPSLAQDGDTVTGHFAVRVDGALPPPLIEALVSAIRSRGADLSWTEVDGYLGRTPIPPEELGRRNRPAPELPAAFVEAEQRARQLYDDQRGKEALEIYLELARSPYARHANILGMVVASMASTQPEQEEVDARIAAAAADPDDPLRQFVAGITAHYSAHYRGKNRENRVWLYNLTIDHLKRCEDAFPEQPRVFLYQAVSHYRLGHQEEAERLIEKAVTLGEHDPDVYYCRAEIWHRKDPEKAVQDIDIYLQKIEEIHQRYNETPPEAKIQRVRSMQEYLLAVAKGDAEYQEIFDPLDPDIAVVAAWEESRKTSRPPTWSFALLGVGLALVVSLLVRGLSRRKSSERIQS